MSVEWTTWFCGIANEDERKRAIKDLKERLINGSGEAFKRAGSLMMTSDILGGNADTASSCLLHFKKDVILEVKKAIDQSPQSINGEKIRHILPFKTTTASIVRLAVTAMTLKKEKNLMLNL